MQEIPVPHDHGDNPRLRGLPTFEFSWKEYIGSATLHEKQLVDAAFEYPDANIECTG